jgi:hypothetical protein
MSIREEWQSSDFFGSSAIFRSSLSGEDKINFPSIVCWNLISN